MTDLQNTTNVVEESVKNASADSIELVTKVIDSYITGFFDAMPKFFIGIFLLIVLWKLTKLVSKTFRKVLEKKEFDASAIDFMTMTVSVCLKIIISISIVTYWGFEVSSLVAMIGASTVAVGLALKGSLQNVAGGIVILILKPFKTGDLVDFGGQVGIVKEIRLFSTLIEKVFSSENVIVPNGAISSSVLINLSSGRDKRVDINFGIAYGSNIAETRRLLIEAANKNSFVVDKSLTGVDAVSLGDSSVNLMLKVWVRPANYFEAYSQFTELVYNTLNENNIEIPFPQIVVNKPI